MKNDMVFPINDDWISRGAPRILDALELIYSKALLVGSAEPSSTDIIEGFTLFQIFTFLPIILVILSRRGKKQ